MKKVIFIALCLILMVQLTTIASASMTLSYTVYEGPLLQEDIDPPYIWNTCLWFSGDGIPATVALFNGADNRTNPIWMDNRGINIVENAGKTFWAASDQDDPDFSRAIDALKNGDHTYAWIYVCGHCMGTGYSIPFSYMLDTPWDVINLHDYNIERIGLSVDLSSHNKDSQSTPGIYLVATSIFELSPIVPEPAPFIVLAVGVAGLYSLGRKKW